MVRCGRFAAVLLLLSSAAAFALSCTPNCEPDPSLPGYNNIYASRSAPLNARTAVSADKVGPPYTTEPVTVTMPSASFNYALPLLSLPGRNGLNLNLTLYYNSRIWTADFENGVATFNADRDYPAPGFRLGFGYVEKNGTTYILTEGDGSKHSLTGTSPYYYSTDATAIQWNSSTLTLRYRNGTTILYQVFPELTNFWRPIRITDTNGNYISIAYVSHVTGSNDQQQIAQITDTLGRVITFSYSNGLLSSIAQGTKTYVAFEWNTAYQPNFNFGSPLSNPTSPTNGSTISVLTRVHFYPSPTTPGTWVVFGYGDWGIVNQIESHAAGVSTPGTLRSYTRYDLVSAASPIGDAPGFAHQYVSPDGSPSSELTYTHDIAKDANHNVTSYTVTGPSLTKTVTTLNSDGTTASVQFRNASGTPLRTVTYDWTSDGGNNVRLARATTLLNDSNQISKVEYAYDQYFNVSTFDEYDWGFTRLRRTQTTYNTNALYTSKRILDRPTQVLIQKDNGSGGWATVARTDVAYDGGSLTSNPGIIQWDSTTTAYRGNPTTVTRYTNGGAGSGGITQTLAYDKAGNLLSSSGTCCSTTNWAYSTATQYAYPDSVTADPSGANLQSQFTYEFATGHLLDAADPNAQHTTLHYDAADRLDKTTAPNNIFTQAAVDDSSSTPSVTVSSNANSAQQVNTYDGIGRLTDSALKDGTSTISFAERTYNATTGRLYQVSNPSDTSHQTTYEYDAYDRISAVKPPTDTVGNQTSYFGNSVTTTDPNGIQRRYKYDALGRLIEVDEPGFGEAQKATGFLTIVASIPPGCTVGSQCFYQDTLSVTVGATTKAVTNCSDVSDVKTCVAWAGETWASNLAAAFTNDANSSATGYASGSTVYFTSRAAGASTNYSVSNQITAGWGGLIYLSGVQSGPTLTGGIDATGTNTLATPMPTLYTYDVLSDLTYVQQALQNGTPAQTRTYVYDSLGRLTSATTPESGTVTYTYNNSGTVATRTDARSVVTTYGYDTLNRLTSISYNTSGTTAAATNGVTYTYGTSAASNNRGRLLTVSNTSESDTYTYDTIGRVTNVARTIGGTTFNIGYSYNNANQLTTLTYPSLRAVTDSYDAIGRLSQIADGVRNYLTNPAYNAAGLTTQFQYGNNLYGCFGYNERLQLASIKYGTAAGCPTGAGSNLLDLGYSYTGVGHASNNGQITGVSSFRADGTQDLTISETFGYDVWYRLNTASTVGTTQNGTWQQDLSYDRVGNLKKANLPWNNLGAGYQTPTSFDFGATGIDLATNHITVSPYHYDAAGNMDNDAIHTYTYDAENRVVAMDAGAAAYTYGPDGLRVRKVAGGTTTTYVRSGFSVVAEYTGSTPALAKEYVYSGGLLASIDASTGAVTYRMNDHLSARLETDASGAVVRTFGHYPYGETWYETGLSKWKFTSYERDGESQLDYANYRSYAPRLGRFTGPDPLGGNMGSPQSLNRYSYVTGDPINSVDPLGLCGEPGDPCVCPPDVGRPWCAVYSAFVSFVGMDASAGGYNYNPNIQISAEEAAWARAVLWQFFLKAKHCTTFLDGTIWCVVGEHWEPATESLADDPIWKNLTLGLRQPGQSFNQCMLTNSGSYSVAGAADFIFGANGQISENSLVGFTPASNSVTQVYNAIVGDPMSALQTMFGWGASAIRGGMGTTLTFGRRTSSITSLNFNGTPGGSTGGTPALGQAPSNASTAQANNAARAASWKLGADIGFFLAEVVGCLGPEKH